MVPGHAGIDQAQVAVGAAAEQGDGRDQVVRALLAAGIGAAHQQPRMTGEAAALRPGQVAGGLPDLAAFDGGTPDHAGPDPERAGGQVRDALESHSYWPDERVA